MKMLSPRLFTFITAVLAGLSVVEAKADPIPGVEQVAPGVQRIDGSKVQVLNLDVTALEAALTANPSFAAARKLLGRNGIPSVGPGGSTVYMCKVRDTVSNANKIVILFVKGDVILQHSIL